MIIIKKLDNGVLVALEEIPYVKSIAFGIWVKNGSRNEREEQNGISHFIEHMLFKGTEKRTAKEIANEMDALGGQMNAYTTKEYTCYHTRTLDENFDMALEIMADMFLNSRFNEQDMEREKDVILEEIAMYEDTPDELVHDLIQNHVLRGSSLGMPILGTKESVSGLSIEEMRAYYEKNYHTENTILSVAGKFDVEEMFEKLNKTFGQWKRKEKYDPYNTKGRYMVSHTSREKDAEQLHLCLSFPGISRDDPMRYAVSVLNTIFGGSMSSRLFQTIREEQGLTYSIYSYPTAFSDVGVFSIYAGMNMNQLHMVLESIANEIAHIKATPLSQELVNRTKERMISNYIIGAESSMNRMISMGSSLLLHGEILTQEQIIENIGAVGAEDILGISQRIFQLGEISWCGIGKMKNEVLEIAVKNVFS